MSFGFIYKGNRPFRGSGIHPSTFFYSGTNILFPDFKKGGPYEDIFEDVHPFFCTEPIYFKTTRKFPERLSNSKKVLLKIYLNSDGVNKCFGPDNFKNLKKFLVDIDKK